LTPYTLTPDALPVNAQENPRTKNTESQSITPRNRDIFPSNRRRRWCCCSRNQRAAFCAVLCSFGCVGSFGAIGYGLYKAGEHNSHGSSGNGPPLFHQNSGPRPRSGGGGRH